MNKSAENPAAAWGSSQKGSWGNTANPFSQMFGATDRIPAMWVSMFPNTEGGQRAAHLTFKAGFDAFLAAGAIALYRAIQHADRMTGLAKSDSPAKGMQSQLSTTFAGSLDAKNQKKEASYFGQDWFRGTQGGTQGLMTDPEAARRFNSVPSTGTVLYSSSYKNADKAIIDTAKQYRQYLEWRRKTGRGIPTNVNVKQVFGQSRLDTPVQAQKKEAATTELAQPAVVSVGNAMSAALPLGAVILATSLAYRATDNYLDKRRNDALDQAISSKENMLKKLIKTRARLAKGNAPERETQRALGGIDNESLYVKNAALEKKGIGFWDVIRGTAGGYAALNSLVLAAAAVGSYAYFSKADENNVRYRAMKHGLQEYARVKSGFSPVAIIPTKSRKFFSEIDDENSQEKKRKKDQVTKVLDPLTKLKSVREEMPVLTDTYNKPISLTL